MRASFDDHQLTPPPLDLFEASVGRALAELTVGQVRTVISEAVTRGSAAVKVGALAKDGVVATVLREIERRAQRTVLAGHALRETCADVRLPTSQLTLLLEGLEATGSVRTLRTTPASEQAERIEYRRVAFISRPSAPPEQVTPVRVEAAPVHVRSPARPDLGWAKVRQPTAELLRQCKATRLETAQRRSALREVMEASRALLVSSKIARAS